MELVQDLLCRILTWINRRCIPLYFRKWVVSVNLGANCVMLTHVYPGCIPNSSNASPIYPFPKHLRPLSPLLGELERRANAHPEELSALLAECHSAYFGAGKGLLVSRLAEEIKGLDPGTTGPELVELVSNFWFVVF